MSVMNIIIAIIVGGIIGWLASLVMRRDASMGVLMNVIVGVIGAFLGNWIGGMLLNRGATLTEFDVVGLLMAFLGAVILLAIVNLFQRGRVR